MKYVDRRIGMPSPLQQAALIKSTIIQHNAKLMADILDHLLRERVKHVNKKNKDFLK